MGLNKEEILSIAKRKGVFKIHKYQYSQERLSKKVRQLVKENKLKFIKDDGNHKHYELVVGKNE